MQIIPVIDLKGGVVVRAVRGDRAAYRPIDTPLSPTADAVDVAAGLLALHPFDCLYVADLDAIQGCGSNQAALAAVQAAFPRLRLWVDRGCADTTAARGFLAAHPGATPVIGSESIRSCGEFATIRDELPVILSLDFRGEAFLGPPGLLADPSLWPDRLIVMSLGRVGSGDGPDLARAESIQKSAGNRAVYLAGGLRNAADLKAAAAIGAAGILVASALHYGRLSAADLA